MTIAVVAATQKEIEPLAEWLSAQGTGMDIQVIVTGVGLMHTTYTLSTRFAQDPPDLAVQAGIGGSMDTIFKPGSVAAISDEVIGDAGAMENGIFKDLFDLQLVVPSDFPYSGRSLPNPHENLLAQTGLLLARGITVNSITTDPARIQELKAKYDPFIESMEGAAFHYVCLQRGLPFVQLRAVSNWVGERDKSKWALMDAITLLNEELIKFIQAVHR